MIFLHLANGRPERLAQRALTFLLDADLSLKAALAERLWPGLSVDPATVSVEEEVPDGLGDASWRTDVVFTCESTPEGSRRKNVELKILASLTEQQVHARERKRIHLLIVPRVRFDHFKGKYSDIDVCAWGDLEQHAGPSRTDGDHAVAWELIRQANDTACLDELTTTEANAEAASMFGPGGQGATWNMTYKFLATIDMELAALTPDGWVYDSLERQPPPVKSDRSYGYPFALTPGPPPKRGGSHRSFWIGLCQDGAEEPAYFALYNDGQEQERYALPASASTLAQRILTKALS